MVVVTAHFHIRSVRYSYFPNKRFSFGSIHLYLVLMTREKALETILVLTLASTIAGLWFDKELFFFIAVGLLASVLISESLGKLIASGWLLFAHYFGIVMNYVIMFLIFYLALCPLAFFQRVFGHNHILRKREGHSHYVTRNHLFNKKDIEKPW